MAETSPPEDASSPEAAAWAWAQTLTWPLTPDALARARYGGERSTATQRQEMRRWLRCWLDEGRVLRAAGGVYDLHGGEVLPRRQGGGELWTWAQALPWPLTPVEVARARYGGEPTERQTQGVRRWLRAAVSDGRLVRVEPGRYAPARADAHPATVAGPQATLRKRPGRGQRRPEWAANWEWARTLDWPMRPADLARARFGPTPSRSEELRAKGWLRRWLREGLVSARGHGVYGKREGC